MAAASLFIPPLMPQRGQAPQIVYDKGRDTTEASKDDDNIVSIDNVHKTYLLGLEGVPALRGVSLDIPRGDFVMILGTSGGGKTSLLNVIGTIDKPTKGKVVVCGLSISDRTKDADLAELRLSKLGFVFQTFNLLSSMTASENVELPMTLLGVPPAERKKRSAALLKRVGLSHRLSHFPSMMSGGEQQRVTIARAISNNPDLLLLDEPTGDLDTRNGKIVMQLLLDINRLDGVTLVMVTHDVHLTSFAKRVVRIRDGKISGIEEIDPARRRDACATLKREVQEIEAQALAGVNPYKNQDDKARYRGKTERREPTDYAPYNFYVRTLEEADPDDAAGAGDPNHPMRNLIPDPSILWTAPSSGTSPRSGASKAPLVKKNRKNKGPRGNVPMATGEERRAEDESSGGEGDDDAEDDGGYGNHDDETNLDATHDPVESIRARPSIVRKGL